MQVNLSGIDVHYQLEGPDRAPVIACSHCLAGSLDIWESQLSFLKSKYRVLRIDTRGHGKTSAPDAAYTMEQLASDAVAVLDVLKIDRVHFMGISMGGMIAQTLALRYPERVSSLILCDTTCIVPEEMRPTWEERIDAARHHGMGALVDGTINRWFSPDYQKQHPDTVGRIREIVLETPISGFIGCSHAISNFNVKDSLPQLDLPTLIMVGENDPGTPVQTARQIHEQIRGSEMVVLPRAYHLSNIEAADAFNRNLMSFLERQ